VGQEQLHQLSVTVQSSPMNGSSITLIKLGALCCRLQQESKAPIGNLIEISGKNGQALLKPDILKVYSNITDAEKYRKGYNKLLSRQKNHFIDSQLSLELATNLITTFQIALTRMGKYIKGLF